MSTPQQTAGEVEFSVIVCSIDQRKFTAVSESYRRALGTASWEMIAIHDAKSLAEAYNRGVAQARGRYLVFSHDDIEIVNDDFAALLRAHLSAFDLIGIAGTTRLAAGKWAAAGDPYVYTLITSPDPQQGTWVTALLGGGPGLCVSAMQALDGVFLATTRELAHAIGFDAATFDGFHLYDLDFSLRAFQSGYRLAVCRDIVLIHGSTGSYDASWDDYRRRFETKHAAALAPVREAMEGARASFTTRKIGRAHV